MDPNFTLKLTGTLLDGGTTADAQTAYLWDNEEAIAEAVVPLFREDKKVIFELIKPKITEIGRWRREAEKALRVIIRDAISKEKKAERDLGRVRTTGRPRKSSAPQQTLASATPNLTSAAPPAKLHDEPIVSPPTSIQQNAAVAPPIQAARPVITTRPTMTTMVRDLDLPQEIKSVLYAFHRNEDLGVLLLKYASIQADWRSVSMPSDLHDTMEWIDAQIR